MHKPTQRVLQVLELLCECGQPQRLTQISQALDVPKSTLLPILQTMVESGFVSRDASEKYSPGVALLRTGAAARAVYSRDQEIRDCLQVLVDTFGETCYYGVLDGSNVLYMEKVDSPQSLRMLTTIGRRMPAYATGLGKALLLDHTDGQLKALYRDKLEPLTKNTVKDIAALSSQLRQARQTGYTWEVEESTEHIRCFGVPVRRDGAIVGAVSIAIPLFRYREEKKEEIIAALQKTAQRLSDTIKFL